ncbi:dehydrogenase/reductase SDR family member 11-like [Ptychodera flava]|uniref:dehydrogenase/reductase SDR family member 11-like n=1 Tax=Ptychodera flava TaxID=63121 RepID=UPI00396A5438
MERWVGRVALVTGASVGLGRTISQALVEHGMVVYGCARNVDKIKSHAEELKSESAKGSLHAVKCDLRNEQEILSMFAEIKNDHGGVDVCINNAGLNFYTTLLEGRTDHWKNMLDVNVLALSICTREAVKQMKERNVDDGHIIHLNSMVGHRFTDADEHFYTGNKFMVTALTEGLRRELRAMGSHIRASCISPAVVDGTEFLIRGKENPGEPTFKGLEQKDIADIVVYILGAPPHMEIHDIHVRGTEQKL